MTNRITKEEIIQTIEMFVNSIYDCGETSGWQDASLQEWLEAVYGELTTWKTDGCGCSWNSNENRFEGKDNIMRKVRPFLIQRLHELKEEGYQIKALQ